MADTNDDRNDHGKDGPERASPGSSDRLWLEVALLAGSSRDADGNDFPRAIDRDGATVLIVAHDPDLRSYLRECLAATALRTVEAADLASAVTTTRGATPDLLILDDHAAEWLPLSAFARVPRIRITDDSADIAPSQPRPAETVVVMPFNARRLEKEVLRCIGRREIPPQERGTTP